MEAFENNGKPDGHISVTGFRKQEFNVEVTCTFTYEESMRHEMLATERYAPGAGDIDRDRKTKKIVAKMEARDADEHISRISRSVIDRYKEKLKIEYSKDTVLIIAFDEIKLCGRHYWGRLFASLEQEGSLSGGWFRAIYLFSEQTTA